MHRPTDQEVDLSVAAMLRFGVTFAALVVLAGGLLLLRHPWSAIPDYSHFHVEEKSLCNFQGILRGTLRLSPPSVIQLGLLVLILTPIARVVFCLVGFARQRNLLYVLVSSAVLTILLISLINGAR
ncbi:MAG: DUF1634 domain-containing protein [Terracidiphilus sp.]